MGELGKFERKLPEDRRRALIEATLACLAREGHGGLSIRKISKEAGISIGLINHHYASKDDLVAAAYETLSLGLLEKVKARIETVRGDPHDRLKAYIRGILTGPTLDRSMLRTWVVFWSMIEHSAKITDVHDRTYAEYRALLESLFSEIPGNGDAPRVNARLAAIGLTAMLDGLWLEWCLNPRTFSPDEAITLCDNWVDALLAGVMPNLLSDPAE